MTEEKTEAIENTDIEKKEFDSERVHVDLFRQKNCRVNLVVKGKAEIAKQARKEALRNIAKEVSIPGFRKGKAPDALIEKKYPKAVVEEWEKAFANLAYKEGQELARVPLLNGNAHVSFKVQNLTQEGGTASYQFESEPVVPDIDPALFKLKEAKEEIIDDAKIDETIKNIQMFYASWEQVENRPAKEGDFVILDIDDMDQDPPTQAFSNARFELTSTKMAGWMRELVLGKSKDEVVEGVSKPDEHESEEVKKNFKPKKVKLYIKGIEAPSLPPVDDELAKRVGAPNASVLRTKLKELLTKQAKDIYQKELREDLSDQLVEKIVFDVPATILEREANHRITTLFKQPGFTRKWNSEMSEEEKKAKKEEITKQSEQALRLFYISRKLAHQNKIQLSEEELAPSYETLLEMMFADPNRVNFKNQSKEQQSIEFSKFMMAKAEDFLIDQIKKAK